jgi:diketogulonate reductase-like aldo/keto reductase
MHTRPIPSTGEALPVVGCGTWRTWDAAPDQRPLLAETARVLFAAGGSVFDTSPMYGAAEQRIGEVLAGLATRTRAFLATKVWTEGRDAGVSQMRRSIDLLRTGRLDLMQIHNLLDWRAHLGTLRRWKAEGRIRYLGVTHYTPAAYGELEAILRAERLDFVQFNYALNDREAERRLLSLAADRGVAVIVNQPFGGGGLLRGLMRRPLPGWAPELGCASWAQALLKFVLGHPAVTCIIPGTGRPEHMRDNVGAGFGSYPDRDLRERMAAAIEK